MRNKRVVVIGAGFAGLSVSSCLAKEGFDIIVIEKNETTGGRARKFSEKGFTFDMGPSWYWMPDVFDSYFDHFGKKTSDYYTLSRLDPSYSVFFENAERWDIPASFEELSALFEKFEVGSAAKLKAFLAEAQYKYEVGINDLVYKPGLRISEFLDWRIVSGVFRLQLLRSLASHVRKYFSHPKIIELLEFPVLFLGAMPSKTPALYSLMNYADMKLGTWYPHGGMYQIVAAMTKLAEELGVKFHFGRSAKSIEISGKKATGVYLDGQLIEADIVVSAADYHHTEQKLLEPQYRNYSAQYWESRTMAPSSLLYYIGLDRKVDGLEHHNLFFDTSFKAHAKEIYEKPAWPKSPLFYVSATSKTDNTVAPVGCENLFILIPTAPGLMDDKVIKEKYFNVVMDRMEQRLEQKIRDHVIFRRDFACSDFMDTYNSFKGNAYGLANTLNQTALLKPSIRNTRIKNLYYTGQLTVPGPGVPPSLISGRVVAAEILKSHRP